MTWQGTLFKTPYNLKEEQPAGGVECVAVGPVGATVVGVECVLTSCGGLAGESPVGVAAKRPCSWWPAEGEIRLSKRHDKVAMGGEQVIGPYVRNPVSASSDYPATAGDIRVPSPVHTGEGQERCEDLGRAAPETRRRIGSGTITQPIVEQERSVSTPASQAWRVLPSGAPVAVKPISVAREVVERRAEVGGGSSSEDRRGQQNPS